MCHEADRNGMSIMWLFGQSNVTFCLIGARSHKQPRESCTPSKNQRKQQAANSSVSCLQIGGGKASFNVLLTSYDFMMGKTDRPRLAKLTWEYIIIDEGHRLKNAGCKLNAEIKMYTTRSRLLLTGMCFSIWLPGHPFLCFGQALWRPSFAQSCLLQAAHLLYVCRDVLQLPDTLCWVPPWMSRLHMGPKRFVGCFAASLVFQQLIQGVSTATANHLQSIDNA